MPLLKGSSGQTRAAESGTIAKISVWSSTAVRLNKFNFDLEFFKGVHSFKAV